MINYIGYLYYVCLEKLCLTCMFGETMFDMYVWRNEIQYLVWIHYLLKKKLHCTSMFIYILEP